MPLPLDCLDLLAKMLNKDPGQRIKIENALEHPYLQGSLAVLPKTVQEADDSKAHPIKIASALGKIFVKQLIDLKISKKDKALA